MATKIQGGGSASGIANVDSNFNLQVSTTLTEELAGYTALTAENDSGKVTGTRYVLSPEVSHDFRLRTANDQTIFNELFPGAAINTTLWVAPVTTATITAAGGFANLNAAYNLMLMPFLFKVKATKDSNYFCIVNIDFDGNSDESIYFQCYNYLKKLYPLAIDN